MDARPRDATAFKTTVREQWDAGATGWDAHTDIVDEWLHQSTDAMLEMAGIEVGSRVLDVAAGSGGQSIAAARRVGPAGRVLASDLAPAFIALIGRNAERCGLANVQARVADGEDLQVAEASFDAAICRLGLMLFPDPLRGLREMHGALRSGGRACTLVFSRPERNPCVAILMSTVTQRAGLPPPDPNTPGGLFSLGTPGCVDELFRSAGFRDVTTIVIDAPFRLSTVDAYLDFIRTSASPILQIMRRLDDAAAAAAWAEMRERLSAFDGPSGWEGPNELLLTVGRRP